VSLQTASRRAAKGLIQRHPQLKNNRAFYELQRRRGFRDVRLRPELTERKDLLEELVGKGVVVVPDYFPRAEVEKMLGAAEETIEKARRAELGDAAYSGEEQSFMWRVKNADQMVPATTPFFEDPTIANVFEAYVSPRIAEFRHEIDYRFGVGEVGQADLFHFDNWRPLCKAFLYLVDVGEKNAPFAYLTGSHRPAKWRRPHEIAFDVHGRKGRFGHLFPQEVRELRAENPDWEELVCTGSAGTLILADLRGLHRGTPLQEGRRVLLNNTFDLMNA
jgi:hypothetical protein